LHLQRGAEQVPLTRWAAELLDALEPVAALLDQAHGEPVHQAALQAQRAKVADPELTPSAQVLATLRERGESFTAFALRQSREHARYFRDHPLDASEQQQFEALARRWLDEQAPLEREDDGDFDPYVAA